MFRYAMTLPLAIGPVGIKLEMEEPPLDPDNRYYRPFVRTRRAPFDLLIRVHRGAAPRRAGRRPAAILDGNWRLYPVPAGWRLEILEQIQHEPRLIALIDKSWKRMDLYPVPLRYRLPSRPAAGWYLGEILNPALPWWFTAFFAQSSRGLVLHAAGLSVEGRGGLFSGPSGAGKSTLSGLCADRRGFTVLSDERVLLWKDHEWSPGGRRPSAKTAGGRWWLGGTPWAGDFARFSPRVVPLRLITALRQARAHGLRALPSGEMITRLLSESFLPSWNAQWLASAAAVAAQAVRDVPSGELSFRKDPNVGRYLSDLLSQGSDGRNNSSLSRLRCAESETRQALDS